MTPPREAAGPLSLLRDASFRRVWMAGAAGNTVRWLEILAVGIYVFDTTGSPFLVALMTVLRALPILLFGALAGTIAELMDRRYLYLGLLAVALTVSSTLGLLVSLGEIALWHIALGAFLSGLFWSAEHPVRRTMMGEIAGVHRLRPAMGMDAATHNLTRVLGPAVGGVLYQIVGLDGAYFLAAALLVLAGILIAGLRYRPGQIGTFSPGGVLGNLLAGFRYVRSERLLVGVMMVTVCLNVFGFPYTSLVAVIGRDTLALNAVLTGMLMSAEATGALIGALLLATWGRPRHFLRFYYLGTVLFLAAVLLFALSRDFGLSVTVLVVGGLGVAAFATMQTTLVLTLAAPKMRSRAMGVMALCIGTGPLGMLHLGLMANWLGAANAILISAVEGAAVLAVLLLLWPELLRPLPTQSPTPDPTGRI